MRSLDDVVKEISKILNKNKIEYVIVGAIAVCSWGNVRTTRDVDVILMIDIDSTEKLVKVFNEKGFSLNKADIKDALKEKTHFTIFDNLSDYHIDATGVYNENNLQTIKNRKKIKIDGVTCYVASAEDTIASKLLFGNEQDVKDAEGIYVRQRGKLDLNYLKKRCRKLNVYGEFLAMKKIVERIENDLHKNSKNY
jgi:hypothetical protein